MSITKKTLALVILDGWGYRKDAANNAVINANTPIMDKLWKERPHTLITASGTQVGLPNLQMGNSEVGHTNIGAGRIVYQDLTRINKEIEDGTFFKNKVLVSTIDKTIAKDKALHVMGLLSPGGVHSHENHIMATLKMAHDRGAKQIYFHAFLDGRDTPPKSALASLQKIDSLFASLAHGKTASIIGRYFAMDRDNNWDRVSCAYNLLTQGSATYNYKTATEALTAAYSRNENDEFVQATTIGTPIKINDDDSIIFMNFRADRARELTRSFLPDFNQFQRKSVPKLNDFVMLTEYAADIKYKVAFPPEELTNTLGEWLAKLNKTQLRISETEKYAHVTFFLNGGVEQVFTGEDRILINSPKVATYDLQPEMSSSELTDNLVAAIASQKYDVIICNYPNGDMVGHTGVYSAAIKACEAVDACIGKVTAAIEAIDGQMLITADHGNAELMVDPITKEPYTAHTNLPVPLIYVGQQKGLFSNAGRLCDLAPTMLRLIDLEIPKEMTGKNLFKRL